MRGVFSDPICLNFLRQPIGLGGNDREPRPLPPYLVSSDSHKSPKIYGYIHLSLLLSNIGQITSVNTFYVQFRLHV